MTTTDYKRRNYQNVQLCEVVDATLSELVSHLAKESMSNYHQVVDDRFGWIDKKYYAYIVKRLKEIMRKRGNILLKTAFAN